MLFYHAMSVAHAAQASALDGRLSRLPWTVGMFLDELAVGAFGQVLLDQEGWLRGYCLARPLAAEWHLMNLGIDVPWQRRGCGRGMLLGAIGHATRSGGSTLTLEVRGSNLPAIGLYDSLGFLEVGRRKGYYADPRQAEDALIMTLPLGDWPVR